MIAQSNEPRNHSKGKHGERMYHLIRDIVQKGDVLVTQIASADNLEDPFMKALPSKVFERHMDSLAVRYLPNWF